MQGGAMGNLKSAIFNGERREFRDLAINETKLWAFNEYVGDYNYKIALKFLIFRKIRLNDIF